MAESLWKANLRLGQRIKRLRLTADLSLRALATHAGCSVSLLSRLEKGQANPSLAMLHAIVAALDTNIGDLFDETHPDDTVVMRSGERPTMSVDAENNSAIILEKLIPTNSSERLQANIHVVAPNEGTEGEIAHDGEELGYVIDGVLELTVDGVSYTLTDGDSFFFSSSLPHSYHNVGEKVGRVLWVNTPPTF